MWILRLYQKSLNSSFDYFLDKVKGRFLAFSLQLVLSYLAVAILTLLITAIIFPILNQGQFSLELLSAEGLFEWVKMIDPVWNVTIVIAVNYLFNRDPRNKRMGFPDFFSGKSSAFWLELVIAIVSLAVILTLYYKNEILLNFSSAPPMDLLLLDQGFENLSFTFSNLLSNWIYYTVFALPIVAVVIVEVRERKRNGFQLNLPIWKILLSTVLISFMLYWMYDGLLFVFSELVMSLIYMPFELIEIPAILGAGVAIFFKTFHFITLVTIIHYILKAGMEKTATVPIDEPSTNET